MGDLLRRERCWMSFGPLTLPRGHGENLTVGLFRPWRRTRLRWSANGKFTFSEGKIFAKFSNYELKTNQDSFSNLTQLIDYYKIANWFFWRILNFINYFIDFWKLLIFFYRFSKDGQFLKKKLVTFRSRFLAMLGMYFKRTLILPLCMLILSVTLLHQENEWKYLFHAELKKIKKSKIFEIFLLNRARLVSRHQFHLAAKNSLRKM